MEIKNFETIDLSTGDHVISFMAEGFWIGVGGDLVIEDDYGNQATFKNLDNGYLLPIGAKKVIKIGTTASEIVAISKRGLPK
ncbi:hypothetical protein Calab_1453 [Caldithrix abyssi DSM 13497]|uniref:Uncharacterized protein n=1 Tax=Caldithrix abyssi DSM 13497 TaxID=880073 RepID=H1XPU8_CALAY|nr:hypothetical protein [Caldithrix abyssi]APF20398.1 hypothetical protein Cabys_3652 [Caldithrix abyssi DSM 13497]EHO41074.1 hypothetical protein Calab_1453 [Caldithrix abyssi DSM 13497]